MKRVIGQLMRKKIAEKDWPRMCVLGEWKKRTPRGWTYEETTRTDGPS
jgi:hypothetical protein